MKQLAPSILSADFGHLAQDVSWVEEGAQLLHIDIMDGHFVPNISFGPAVMKALVGRTNLPFDVHLMIENPDAYLESFVTAQTAYVTVHQEACPHLHRTIQHIKGCGVKAGVAINPATPVSILQPILGDLDLVLIMSVNPGFGGQKFIDFSLDKIRELDTIRNDAGLAFAIEVDGGISLQNAAAVSSAGVDIFVAGSSVFGAEDPGAACGAFQKILCE